MFKNKKGVFGLTAVQSFFMIILGIAMLAYVIVIIMGTLNQTTILTPSIGARVTNETVTPTDSGTTLSKYGTAGCAATMVHVINASGLNSIASSNYRISGCVITNLTSTFADQQWNLTYDWTYDSPAQVNLQRVLSNTSTGISGFFANISPVYAILAVLVIILVLIVLVRVVQGGGGRSESPQL